MKWKMAAVAGIALWLRVGNLDAIPIAGDESVYLRWAEIIVHQKQWFISLLDGKQPLTYWLYALGLVLQPEDPLTPARWLSALAGTAAAVGIFAIARRLADKVAGLTAASLYVVLPYALLYDRLAYAEAFVNLAGVAIVYTSLARRNPFWLGLALGLGFFVKSTTLLFWFFPLLAALWLRSSLLRLAVAYGIAAVFPLISWLSLPRAPMMQTHSLVVHQTSFFVAPAELLRNPLVVAPQNLRLMSEYLAAYLTIPIVLAGLAALGYLVYRRSTPALVVISVSVLPLLVQIFLLQKMFPTRYPFPHVWPWLVVIGMAAAALPRGRAVWLAALAAVPMLVKAAGTVTNPQEYLYTEDARTFLGSGPAAGWGLREAAAYLRNEARAGPLTVFTDPIWGPPADAVAAYLNGRDGIQVFEAWWTTISADHPILPPVPVELVKSQYERVSGGMLDPRTLSRVYYVTETHYNPPDAVRRRQPGARLQFSLPKPGGRNSIDVYRLR